MSAFGGAGRTKEKTKVSEQKVDGRPVQTKLRRIDFDLRSRGRVWIKLWNNGVKTSTTIIERPEGSDFGNLVETKKEREGIT